MNKKAQNKLIDSCIRILKRFAKLITRLQRIDIMSDRFRLVKVCFLFAVVLDLSLYSFYIGREQLRPDFDDLVSGSPIYDGASVEIGNAIVASVTDQFVLIQKHGALLAIEQHDLTRELRKGDSVSLRGVFRVDYLNRLAFVDADKPAAYVSPTVVRKEVSRVYDKYLSSFFPLVVIAILFLRVYRFDIRAFEFVERARMVGTQKREKGVRTTHA